MAKTIAGNFKEAGIDAGQGKTTKVDPTHLTVIDDKAHPLYDPRVALPIDAAMLADIQRQGVIQPVTVRSNGLDEKGAPILEVIDGRQRVKHLIEANKLRKVEGEHPYRIECKTVSGSDADMVMLAMASNCHKRAETIRSLAFKVQNAIKLGEG